MRTTDPTIETASESHGRSGIEAMRSLSAQTGIELRTLVDAYEKGDLRSAVKGKLPRVRTPQRRTREHITGLCS